MRDVGVRVSFELSEKAARAIRMSDDEEAFARLQPGGEEPSDGVEEELLALAQLDGVTMGVRPLEEGRIQ